jgi:tight adherence protein B
VTGFLLGLVFAAGLGLLWAGAVCGVEPRAARGRLSRRRRALPLSPLLLVAVVATSVLAALLVWSLVDVPVLAFAAAIAGAYAPVASAGRAAAIDGLTEHGERTADTVALLLRAGLLELPAGGLAPMLRELSVVLSERLEARERARSRGSTLQVEAAILAVTPIVLFLLIGLASPEYLNAYRTPAGTLVGLVGGLLIFGCYLLMLQLGRVPEPRRTGTER